MIDRHRYFNVQSCFYVDQRDILKKVFKSHNILGILLVLNIKKVYLY